MIEILLATILNGSIQHDDYKAPGLIGVRVSPTRGTIQKVYIGSPAYWIGIKPLDRLVSLKPYNGCHGEETVARIKRGKEILIFTIRRESKKSFYTGFSLTKDGVREDGSN